MAERSGKSGKKKVLIVDDHPLICRGITDLAEQEPDLVVCGEVGDVPGALKAIEKLKPDIVVVDISLKDSNGIELIKDIKVRWPALPVLVFSMHNEVFFTERVLRAGARGYISKREPPMKVIEGIRELLKGGVCVSEEMTSQMIERFVGSKGNARESGVDGLTDREYEVFEWIGKGLPTRDIAEKLHLSVKTVEAHRDHIKRKLKLDSAAELVRYAIQWVQLEAGA
ncbi:MAG TPA: response regulator transcription factor [Phycisphaerae bacterium]|nr:response regulator transcription factor [Phycisphaerae bacterium]